MSDPKSEQTSPQHTNRLIQETSPYLLQHAHNSVDWHPWGDEALAQEREAARKPFPEMVKYMDGCWHCLHPEFLRDQLTRSLDRLQQETLDVCLLHNPEYFLSDAKKRGRGSLETIRKEFSRRLRDAFAFLETQVAALEAFRAQAARQGQAVSDAVAAALSPHLPLLRAGESLSRKALWVLASTPGVSSVLLGMRHPAYVKDGMAILAWPPLQVVRPIYEAMRQVRVGRDLVAQ